MPVVIRVDAIYTAKDESGIFLLFGQRYFMGRISHMYLLILSTVGLYLFE